jgi:hypothetical protein
MNDACGMVKAYDRPSVRAPQDVPHCVCPVRTCVMNTSTSAVRTEDRLAHFMRIRRQTLALCATLTAEDLMVQSMPDASPGKWHLAHTTWFFEHFVLGRDPAYRSPNAAWYYLLNSYYESVGPMHARPQRGVLSRPTLEEVRDYRARIDEAVGELMQHSTKSWLRASNLACTTSNNIRNYCLPISSMRSPVVPCIRSIALDCRHKPIVRRYRSVSCMAGKVRSRSVMPKTMVSPTTTKRRGIALGYPRMHLPIAW